MWKRRKTIQQIIAGKVHNYARSSSQPLSLSLARTNQGENLSEINERARLTFLQSSYRIQY